MYNALDFSANSSIEKFYEDDSVLFLSYARSLTRVTLWCMVGSIHLSDQPARPT